MPQHRTTPRRLGRAASLLALAVSGAFAASGCTTAATAPPKTSPRPAPTAATTDATPTDADRALLRHAERLLVQGCMTRQGFTYWVGPLPGPEESHSVGYLLDDVAWARKHGYGSRINARESAARDKDPNAVYRASLSSARLTAYNTALMGGPDTPELSVRIPGGGTVTTSLGGCEAEAQERLYGDRAAWFRAGKITGGLNRLYASRLLRDPAFLAAQAKWATCLRRAGHPYATPGEARAALPRLTRGLAEDAAFAVELRLATADATCVTATGFARTGRDVERRYLDGLRGTYGEAMATHARMERAALARAQEITRDRG